jgi:hypothetical protein
LYTLDCSIGALVPINARGGFANEADFNLIALFQSERLYNGRGIRTGKPFPHFTTFIEVFQKGSSDRG